MIYHFKSFAVAAIETSILVITKNTNITFMPIHLKRKIKKPHKKQKQQKTKKKTISLVQLNMEKRKEYKNISTKDKTIINAIEQVIHSISKVIVNQ